MSAVTEERFEDDLLLERYLAARAVHGPAPEEKIGPGRELRTCASCGEHSIFKLDPNGTWYECSACGALA
jgi:hypothetical protein